MRAIAIAGSLLLLGLVGGCGPSGDSAHPVVIRQHFAGLRSVTSRPDLAVVGAILAKPESRRLMDDVTRKLAVQLPAWFGATPSTNHAVALAPWVRAMLDAESVLEVRAGDNAVQSWAWAGRLDAGSAQAGQDLGRALAAVLGGTAPAAGAGSWEIGNATAPAAARFVAANGWVVVGRGTGPFDAFRDRLQKGEALAPAMTNDVLRVDADLRRLAQLAGWPSEPAGPVAQWPQVQLSVEPRNGRLRTQAQLSYEKPHALSLVPWTVPISVVTEPLVGFTAMQGADTWLNRVAWLGDLGVKEWPRQFFFWSLGSRPWQQYFAGPLSTPTNVIAQVAPTLPFKLLTNSTWQGQSFGIRVTNQATRVELRGLPFFAPFLEAIKEGSQEMIFGGLFLPAKGAPLAPQELIGQVAGRTNLVLYDWEITGRAMMVTNPPGGGRPRVETNQIGRLVQYKHLTQFRTMMSAPVSALPTTPTGEILVAGSAWTDAVLPVLGDTVTEVTLAGPSRLALTRQSQVGFNSMELMYLLRWIENPGFPGWADPAPLQPRRRPEGKAAAAAPAPPVPAPAAPKPAVATPKTAKP